MVRPCLKRTKKWRKRKKKKRKERRVDDFSTWMEGITEKKSHEKKDQRNVVPVALGLALATRICAKGFLEDPDPGLPFRFSLKLPRPSSKHLKLQQRSV